MNVSKSIKLDLSDMKIGDKTKLLKVIARISEASYRRGVEQGHVAINAVYCVSGKDLHKFRYGVSLDKSFFGLTGVDRIYLEYGLSLDEIGLYKHESRTGF